MTGATESTGLISRGSQSFGLVLGGALFVALAVLTAFGLWSTVTLGGVEEGVWLLGGRHLYVKQPVIDVGAVRPGETITVEFSVQNLFRVPLTVLGARTELLLLLLCRGVGSASDASALHPVLISGHPVAIDLGSVPSGSRHVLRFELRNQGSRPVQIVRVRIGCAACLKLLQSPPPGGAGWSPKFGLSRWMVL
jgi:hypothetical protein